MDERTGEAFELDQHLTVVGTHLKAGDPAPEFALEHVDPTTQTMQVVHLADSAGHVRLLNVVNSLDTPVCHRETRQWETLRTDLPPMVVLYTISMDLPYAQARWQRAWASGSTRCLPITARHSGGRMACCSKNGGCSSGQSS